MEQNKGIENFREYLEKNNLSKNTIYQYLKYIKLYANEYGLPTGEDEFIITKNIETLKLKKDAIKDEKASTKSQTLKAVVSFRKSLNLPVSKIIELYSDVNKEARMRAEELKHQQNEELMSFSEYNKLVDDLYDEKDVEKLRQYLINKILTIANVRNMDLVARLITPKEYDSVYKNKPDENYLYLDDNKVYLVRNKYKTVGSYGTKISIIREPRKNTKINTAFRLLKNYDDMLVPKEKLTDLSRYITKLTFGLGETKLFKIVLRENNTLGKASKLSENRGTSLATLQQNYNIVED